MLAALRKVNLTTLAALACIRVVCVAVVLLAWFVPRDKTRNCRWSVCEFPISISSGQVVVADIVFPPPDAADYGFQRTEIHQQKSALLFSRVRHTEPRRHRIMRRSSLRRRSDDPGEHQFWYKLRDPSSISVICLRAC